MIMELQKAVQSTEFTLKLVVTIPGQLPPVFMKEYVMKMEKALREKAEEIAKDWDGDIELKRSNELDTHESVKKTINNAFLKFIDNSLRRHYEMIKKNK